MVNSMSADLESIEHELEESIASLRKAGIRITPKTSNYTLSHFFTFTSYSG